MFAQKTSCSALPECLQQLLIERSNSGKFTKDVHCQVTGVKDAAISTGDLDSFVNAHGDVEADLLDEAMALQSPNFIPEWTLGVHIIPTCDNDVCDDTTPNCDNDVCDDIFPNSDNDVYDDILSNSDKDLKQWSNLKNCNILETFVTTLK
ncbi:hypothetical protein CDAR_168711 [Caerostris darwini]|uniref:Uncharacterized protein n=1 Tax=Caerostris darwini TaxID=1538125 RepID=A0AAV4T2Z9_9ARAC|nr:hypothetical protein CDAR_168711 [Caerostris darwini]